VEGSLTPDPLDPVVGTPWLATHRAEVVVTDVRWYLDGRSGRAAYDQGHLPGAVFIDLETCLASAPSAQAGRHPLPTPAVFAEGLAAAGISDDDVVVAYDDGGAMPAARLVWLLRVTGHRAALLDGGLAAWSGPLSASAPQRRRGHFTARPWPEARLASADDAATVAGRPGSVLVDARASERYRGEVEPVDPRAGHIPGAVNLPYADNLDPATGRWRSPDELRQRFESVGAGADADVIVYCGSGVSACHDLLARERAGLTAGRLYAGSWSQWSSDLSRPAATGAAP
jgi:thiosulfate/3-mercaptopyruvate sulfurtransferase